MEKGEPVSTLISRKVAVTLPEFSFCFSKNVLYTQSGAFLTEKWPPTYSFAGRGPPPFQLHPGAPRGQRLENTVNTSVFSSSSPQQWPKTMQFTAFFVAVRQKTP